MKSILLGALCISLLGAANAATVTLDSVDQGTAFDANKDGIFDSINYSELTAGSDGANNTSRGLLEYALSSISGNVTSAVLKLHTSGVQYQGGLSLDVEFHGYIGDGVVAPSDALVDNLISAIQIQDTSIDLNVDVTSIVQPLPAYAGFMIRLTDETVQEFQQFSSNSLVVNYSPVPIPPALYLFGSGLIGLLGITGRFRSAPRRRPM